MINTLIDTTPTKAATGTCHSGPQQDTAGLPLVAIVGSPNVGKSVLFNTLTGLYVTVSNYPGTTVEVTRGKGTVSGRQMGVVDTPGMYGLLPITEEERVARQILLEERPKVVVHVIDTKNIERMLPMTLQLIDAGLPVMLVLNLMDEAERIGIHINIPSLEAALGIPVIGTALAVGRGSHELRELVARALQAKPMMPLCKCGSSPQRDHFPAKLSSSLNALMNQLQGNYTLSKEMIALLLLQNDTEVAALVKANEGEQFDTIDNTIHKIQDQFSQPLSYIAARHYRDRAVRMLQSIAILPAKRPSTLASRLSDLMIRPLTGIPFLLLALYLLYEFVGVFGAQTLVEFLEATVFEGFINPFINSILTRLIPWAILRELFGGEFGMLTLGFRYAVALIFPIVGTFFLAFSVIEDSGYLPRLAMLIDRVFKKIGLNGRAVIPLVLGFGCDTMATIVTRTLETRRERILSTLLLSLAIPCSAQLGIMLAMLSGRPDLLAIWIGIVGGIFLLVGYIAQKLMPGERPSFYMELPPLRLPTLKNVLVKTYTRMEWYFKEVFPMFIIASVVIWLGRITGLFDLMISWLTPLVTMIGLPKESAFAFLFGFFRRDYGAAGLYDMRETMTAAQLLISTTVMTLFVPCIAQFAVTIKERGWKTAVAMAVFIFPFAFIVGGALYGLLKLIGVA